MQTAKTDQTGRMPRLIRVFAGRTGDFVCFVMRRLKKTVMIYRDDRKSRSTLIAILSVTFGHIKVHVHNKFPLPKIACLAIVYANL